MKMVEKRVSDGTILRLPLLGVVPEMENLYLAGLIA
jgi:hypothetical protein